MACACPCFGDEADAEEKPNQMIQLDGLGMLRLDTQHVGQGSQGMRSAKWFYFGETDNRLAVVNLLLCITCAMMWLCIFLAAQNGAFTWTAPKKLIVAEQHSEAIVEDSTNDAKDYVDLKKKYDDQVATGKVKKSKTVALTKHTRIIEEFNEYKVNHPEEVTKDMNQELITQKTGLEDQLKTAKQEITTRTAVLENLKADIDEIQSEFGSEKIELKKLPDYVRSIHESKEETENQLQDMKALAERWKIPAKTALDMEFSNCQRRKPDEVDAWYLKEYPVLYKEFLKDNSIKAATNDELDGTTNDSGEKRKLNDDNTGALG
eukprot:563629_1